MLVYTPVHKSFMSIDFSETLARVNVPLANGTIVNAISQKLII